MPPAKPWPFEMPTTSTRSPGSKPADRDGLADFDAFDAGAKLAHEARGLNALFLEMSSKGTGYAGLFNRAEAERNGIVAMRLFRARSTTVQGPASITVTGTLRPSSVNTLVIPTLRPRMFFT
jgi:hypothetical protein